MTSNAECFAYIKEGDEKPASTPGQQDAFGQLMSEFGGSSSGGWVHGQLLPVEPPGLGSARQHRVSVAADALSAGSTLKMETRSLPECHLSERTASWLLAMTIARLQHVSWLPSLLIQVRHSKTEHPAQHVCHGTSQHGTRAMLRSLFQPWRRCTRIASSSLSIYEADKQDCRKFCTGCRSHDKFRDFKTSSLPSRAFR